MQTWALISSSQVTSLMSEKAELQTTHPRSSTSVPILLRIGAIERVEAPRLSESSTKTGYVYTFGAPGHGKGPFDGYGGSFKNKIHSLIKSYSQTDSIPGTRTGFINEVRDVFDALLYYYEKGIGRQAQANAKTDEFKFFLYEIGEDTAVPRPVEEFNTMSTITKQYKFAVNNEGLLLSEGSVNPVPKL